MNPRRKCKLRDHQVRPDGGDQRDGDGERHQPNIQADPLKRREARHHVGGQQACEKPRSRCRRDEPGDQTSGDQDKRFRRELQRQPYPGDAERVAQGDQMLPPIG